MTPPLTNDSPYQLEHLAGLVTQALAGALVRERQDVAADRHLVVVVEDPVSAATDHLRRSCVAELLDQPRQQLRQPPAMRRCVEADLVDPVLDELCTRSSIMSRISRTSSIERPAGSGMSQSSTRVGTYGQTSPQPIVTAQSA